MTYLLKSYELDYAYPPNQSEMFVGQLGGILVQVWVLMHLWQWSQYPYLISFQVFPENCLTVSTFGNFISSSILGGRVCISTWWESNIYSLVWNTLYQILISGVFVLEGPTSLSGQLHWVWNTKVLFTTYKETFNIWIKVSQCKAIFRCILWRWNFREFSRFF
jgi:hypothetical protein